MLLISKAYAKLKKSHQDDTDVVLMLCHAVPALNAYMKAVDGGGATKLPDPDHFQEPQPHDRLRAIIPRYRKVIGRMIFFASFSYFEAYVKDLILELIDFHGGTEKWVDGAKKRLDSKSHDIQSVRKLRERPKEQTKFKYKKAIRELENVANFRFPSERLSIYGIYRLGHEIGDMRAADIAGLVQYGLGLQILPDPWDDFKAYRDRRNEIAHGNPMEIDLTAAIKVEKFLFELAKEIDQHVVEKLMIIENP